MTEKNILFPEAGMVSAFIAVPVTEQVVLMSQMAKTFVLNVMAVDRSLKFPNSVLELKPPAKYALALVSSTRLQSKKNHSQAMLGNGFFTLVIINHVLHHQHQNIFLLFLHYAFYLLHVYMQL